MLYFALLRFFLKRKGLKLQWTVVHFYSTFSSFSNLPVLINSSIFFPILSPIPGLQDYENKQRSQR